jgi:4-alpha-glucanotransferase
MQVNRLNKVPTLLTRAGGILLHPTSLPSDFGTGDIGPGALRFADDLKLAGLRWWQMLPITPPGPGPEYSPYSSLSAFAGSPWLISPEWLYRDGFLKRQELARHRRPKTARIDFALFRRDRRILLTAAFERFERIRQKFDDQIESFSNASRHWLNDYCLYCAIKDAEHDKPWTRWQQDLRLRQPLAMERARKTLARGIELHRFLQWAFNRQWRELKEYCARCGIGLIGDIPIFVAHDSVAVWGRPDLFLLDDRGIPLSRSGYPPDPFTPRGQLWGHPHYRWPAHAKENFAWWVARFGRLLEQFDAVRIDHFLGFHRLWAVPEGARDAVHGRWLKVPGDAVFTAVRKKLGNASIIAEDLGNLTPRAIALREKFRFPGMRIMQWAFGEKKPYNHPSTYPKQSVAYTGTHDNQTLIGWLEQMKKSGDENLSRAMDFVGNPRSRPHFAFIRALFASNANTVIVPIQDVLGLGDEDRMNVPGVLEGNWGWRMRARMDAATVRRMKEICEATGRAFSSPLSRYSGRGPG